MLRHVLACFLVLLSPSALAFDGFGVLVGRVVYEGYLPVAGAVVTVFSPNLMGEQTVVTDEQGWYRVPQLPPGDYTLVFHSDNPEHFHHRYGRIDDVRVRLNRTYRADVNLGCNG